MPVDSSHCHIDHSTPVSRLTSLSNRADNQRPDRSHHMDWPRTREIHARNPRLDHQHHTIQHLASLEWCTDDWLNRMMTIGYDLSSWIFCSFDGMVWANTDERHLHVVQFQPEWECSCSPLDDNRRGGDCHCKMSSRSTHWKEHRRYCDNTLANQSVTSRTSSDGFLPSAREDHSLQ